MADKTAIDPPQLVITLKVDEEAKSAGCRQATAPLTKFLVRPT